MKNMEKKRRLSGNAVTLLMTAVIAAVCAGMLYSGAASRQMSSMLVSMTCYIAMAVSLNLVVGLLGELSLGHAGFMSAGLFTGCLFSLATADSLPLIVRLPAAMLIGGLAAALVGLIVGLPGETDDEFAELCEFLQNVAIERVGVFEYSPEEGTEAAEMPDQIDAETKQNRRLIVEELQSGVLDDYNTSRHGEVMQVLCEGFDDEQQLWYGRTYADSVEVDGHVYFDAMDTEPGEGEFVSVLITESLGPDLLGVRQKEA